MSKGSQPRTLPLPPDHIVIHTAAGCPIILLPFNQSIMNTKFFQGQLVTLREGRGDAHFALYHSRKSGLPNNVNISEIRFADIDEEGNVTFITSTVCVPTHELTAGWPSAVPLLQLRHFRPVMYHPARQFCGLIVIGNTALLATNITPSGRGKVYPYPTEEDALEAMAQWSVYGATPPGNHRGAVEVQYGRDLLIRVQEDTEEFVEPEPSHLPIHDRYNTDNVPHLGDHTPLEDIIL